MTSYNSKDKGVTKLAANYEESTNNYNEFLDSLENGDSPDDNLGRINLKDTAKGEKHSWENTLRHWGEGSYPTEGARKPHAGFSDRLAQLPTVIKHTPGEELHPAIQAGKHVFSGIKNWDNGRHFDIHLSYEPDANDENTYRLKANTYNAKGNKYRLGVEKADVATHGDDHKFDVGSGEWHHDGGKTHHTESYNSIDLIKHAPEDMSDSTHEWESTPGPAEAFCPTCHRFPKHLDKQLELMFPTKCTVCGEHGRAPNYVFEPGQFTDITGNEEKGTPLRNVETSGFNVQRGLICGNNKCRNYKKSVAMEHALVDNKSFDVVHPGAQEYGFKKIFKISSDTHKQMSEQHDKLVNETLPQLAKTVEEARQKGDLRENGDYQAAKDEQGRTNSHLTYLKNILDNHEIDESVKPPEGSEDEIAKGRFWVDTDLKVNENVTKGKKVSIIKLPTTAHICDHEDCPDNSVPIPSKVRFTPDKTMRCMHCGRSSEDGVDVAHREDGYTRCNPLTYGANNCAPAPHGVDAYKPDPTHKFPVVKRDKASGQGLLYQKQPEEQDYTDPHGLYPGYASVQTKVPGGTLREPTRGFEDPRNYFTHSKGQTPWKYLGMVGRGIAKGISRVFPGGGDVNEQLGAERITPDHFKTEVSTPEAATGALAALAGHHFDEPENEPSPLSPNLSMDEYSRVFHRLPAHDINKADIVKQFIEEGKKNPAKFPVEIRDDAPNKKQGAKTPISEGESTFDPEDPESSYLDFSSFMPSDESKSETISMGGGDVERTNPDDIVTSSSDDVGETCPECKGDSIFNKPDNAIYHDSHCKSCEDKSCGSEGNTKSPHCAGCRFPGKDCEGKPKLYWRSPKAVCPTCNNTGEIDPNRSHCTTCNGNCKGINREDQNHCLGCKDEDEPSEGMHLPAKRFSEGHNYDEDDTEDGKTESKAEDYLGDVKRDMAQEDLSNEGFDTETHSDDVVDFLTRQKIKTREEQLKKGLVAIPTEEERAGAVLKEIGPVKYQQGVENRVLPTDRRFDEALAQDVENMGISKPRFEGQEKPSRLDSPVALSDIARMREDAPDLQDRIPDQPSIGAYKTEQHSPWCKCGGSGIVSDPEEISKINRSPEFLQGMAKLRSSLSREEFNKKKKDFIVDQYRCKEM